MPRRDAAARLADALLAADRIAEVAAALTYEQYAADWKTRSIIERQFENLGEAVKQAIAIEPALQDRIPEAARIIAFRNRLAHGYHSVKHEIVWEIINTDLPEVHTRLKMLAAE